MFDQDDFSIQYEWRCNEDVFHITHFAVDESQQGFGRASAILETLVRIGYYEGAKVIGINMGGGDKAVKFLERNGFYVYEKHEYSPLEKDHYGSEYGVHAVRKIR